ncbi:MAG: MerR family DNA-binding transcriptional regulator [Patescibacteria group bacterium]|nr:MerR family DNA-binding transcriptional regulator [Patescibacteria group bacterium]
MTTNNLKIGEAAEILGVSALTLRKWAENGKLIPTVDPANKYRFYSLTQVEEFIKTNAFIFAKKWSRNKKPKNPPNFIYCQNSSVFQARLSKMRNELIKTFGDKPIFSLLVAMAGEIGNNSFDHNIGNWPDIPGLFFCFNTAKREIILADRGQGVLKTLKRAAPELNTDEEALEAAFTRIISGRSPESRGNGLKFVRKIVEQTPIDLFFQSGEAELAIAGYSSDLKIKRAIKKNQGCLVLIKF